MSCAGSALIIRHRQQSVIARPGGEVVPHVIAARRRPDSVRSMPPHHVPYAVVGQACASASASCVAAANASGPCSTAAGSIHMTCQPWPSRSKKLREYMKP
ncbi:hypothetical protein FBY34_8441 [Streptomyces sp. SLBN-115]|nr:hypothetical protein FBY34_8441 [Streptomyces sp. SLBN-115]